MKLLNYTSSWFLLALFLILLVWAGLSYLIMLDEIYDSMDDGLDNQKSLIIRKAAQDSSILKRMQFDEGNYLVRKVPPNQAINHRDEYRDTLMYRQNEQDNEPVRLLVTAFEQNGKYYQLQVITSMVEEDDLIEDLLYSLLFLFLGLTASMIILNNLMLKKIWQPFYLLLERLQKFRLDDPQTIQPTDSRIEEFRLLNSSVRKLLESNIQAYNNQKQFIENAAHELQTPLAISLNKLELLVSHRLEDDQLVLVGSVMDNLERLIRLNKSLLLLSRISNQQFIGEEAVNLNDMVRKAIHEFSDQAAYKGISISLKETGEFRPKMNPDLAQTLVVNLLKNAIVHNHPKGKVNLLLSDTGITVENTGKEEPLDAKHIFERFYKQGSSLNSTGLGLAIVKAITDLYRLSIHYHYAGKHIFKINFKNS